MTDPIADFLARIRNGIMARKASVDMPASKMKVKLAELLRDEGYLLSVTQSDTDGPQGTLSLTLRWDANRRPAIAGLRRVSKPGQRAYVPSDKLPKVRRGMGTAIVSTSKGIMTDRDARKQGVGGEVICEVW
jgi:small subunit ribosomal protein S8